MKRFFILYSLLILSFSLQAQYQPTGYEDLINTDRITLQDSSRNKSIFYTRKYHKKAKDSDTYYWYTARTIQKSRGAYSGKVLHGSFEQFYPDKKLAQKGQFKKGLKQGEWKEWSTTGAPTKISNWKRSREQGPYRLFDPKGALKEQGNYVDGQRDGKTYQYDPDNGARSNQYYRQGTLISKEEYIQQNIFRRSGYYLQQKWQAWFSKKHKETQS